MPDDNDITAVLDLIRAGDAGAKDRLVELIYDDLRTSARRLMRRERVNHTLPATAVVHESIMRLMDTAVLERFENKRHLLAAATVALQRVLIDHARTRGAKKRGADRRRVPIDKLDEGALAAAPASDGPPEAGEAPTIAEDLERLSQWYEERGLDIVALDEALDEMRELDPRWADVILLRFFGGYTIEQTAELLGVSMRTVTQDWNQARAWLKVRLGDRYGGSDVPDAPAEGSLRAGEPAGGS